jgi:hypothetical protein
LRPSRRGLPEKIKSEGIEAQVIAGFRAQAEKWFAAEAEGKPVRGSRSKPSPVSKIDLTSLI